MKLSHNLILVVILLALPVCLPAQEETQRHYRVELIVVRHLAGSSDSTPQDSLRDFTTMLDLHAPAEDLSTEAEATLNDQIEASAIDPALTGSELPAETPLAVRIDDMSDGMREAFRRLRGSAGFRPELFRAWEQSGDSSSVQLRIHDDEVLFEVDPAAVESAVPVDEHGALVFSDATIQQKNSPAGDLLQEESPPTQYYYRIDGTVTLNRSRFLHLDLDIELREPLSGQVETEGALEITDELTEENSTPEPTPNPAPNQALANPARTGPAADATAFRIHRIQQRRQVKAGQMEYFDGPVIGVLALVTGFDISTGNETPVAEIVE